MPNVVKNRGKRGGYNVVSSKTGKKMSTHPTRAQAVRVANKWRRQEPGVPLLKVSGGVQRKR